MGKEISTRTVIVIAVGVSLCLAIGLGVGLGVGLKKEVIVYVTEARRSTREQETTTTVTPDDAPWLNYRLPHYIVPSHYKLNLEPDVVANVYSGRNEITFRVLQSSRYVLIHAHESLDINEDTITLEWNDGSNPVRWGVLRTFRYPKYEFFVVEVQDPMPTGEEFVLTLAFTNSLTDAFVGIFKTTYTDPDGSEKSMVVSDMVPTNTRRGYPCFDEPAMKIRYTTSIVHDEKYIAISNMPVKMISDVRYGFKMTTFEESVPMSTYLACFILCEFDFVEEFSNRNVPLRIYATPTQIAKGEADYALEITKILLDKYEELFDMQYTLAKYDQIIIPNYATFGAMENWGIVTFRESALLWNKNESSTANKQRVVAVVAHEMVHQWFGNLVTLSWWENLWLNEGFASYLEYKGMELAEPDWLAEGHHVIDDVQLAMGADALSGSHPLKVNVSTPAQISEVFDNISYQKGSSVLKMMNDIIGDDFFLGGLRQYLKDHQFSNTNEQDLYISIQKYIDDNGGTYNITDMMDPWVQQHGFPIVNIRNNTSGKGEATQRVMLADTNSPVESLPKSPYQYRWTFKLDSYSQKNTSELTGQIFDRNKESLDFTLLESGDWIKVNYKERGYFRVNYDEAAWAAFSSQLIADKSAIHEYDRCHLLDDAFNLAAIKQIPYTAALDMTKYLDQEDSYFVWAAYSSGSSYIKNMLASTDQYGKFLKYYLTKVKPIADNLGWDASQGTHEERRNRPIVLGLALVFGDQDALDYASDLFAEWKNGGSISPDIRSLVYQYGILNGDESDWKYMLARFTEEHLASEKDNLLRGLASSEDIVLIARLLDYSKNKTIISDQEFFDCISYVSYTTNGNKMAWSWVRTNWNYMVERFTLESRKLGLLIPTIVSSYKTELKRWEVMNFFNTNPEGGAGEASRVNALLQINLNIAWLAENEHSIGEWLQDRMNELS